MAHRSGTGRAMAIVAAGLSAAAVSPDALSAGGEAQAQTAPVAVAEVEVDRYRGCVDGMIQGYRSGLQETFCRGAYDLPSPFFFKCAQGLRIGFESDTARRACASFFTRAGARAAERPIRP